MKNGKLRSNKVALFLIIVLAFLYSGCSIDSSVTLESELTTDTVFVEPEREAEVMNSGIDSSVNLENHYYFELKHEIMPYRGYTTSYVAAFDVEGDSYAYSMSDTIVYTNEANNQGIEFSIIGEDLVKRTSNITFIGNDLYFSQLGNENSYVCKCFITEEGSLGNSYWYELDSRPAGNNHEFFDNDTYYCLTEDSLLKYSFRIGDFGDSLEPEICVSVSDALGLIKINNNIYVAFQSDSNPIYLISAVDLFNGDSDNVLALEDVPTLYNDSKSEFINFLGVPMYAGFDGFCEINLRMPYGYTSSFSFKAFDVNSDGSIYYLSFNNIYEFVPGDSEIPEVESRYPRGRFYVVWHPSAIYEDEDGRYATVTIIEPVIYADEAIEQFSSMFADSYYDTQMHSTDVRVMTCGMNTVYAVHSSNGLWTLYNNPEGYFAGIGGGNLWLMTDEVTLRLSDDVTFNLAIPSQIEDGEEHRFGTIIDNTDFVYSDDEVLIASYQITDYDSTVITVRDNQILDVTFISSEV